MPRPCHALHDLRPPGGGCPACDSYHANPAHRARWGAEPLRPPCPHLGAATGGRAVKLHCAADPPQMVPLRSCSLHGACTEDTPARDTSCCRYCPDRP